MKQKLFTLLFAMVASVSNLLAYDFQYGDLYYNILADKTNEVEVTYINYEMYAASRDNYTITSADIPSSVIYNGINYNVTRIGEFAFAEDRYLTAISIPNSVTSIGDYAFFDCTGLTSVTIPNSVTSIGGAAFYNCSGLTSVTIPNSVTSIGYMALWGCSGLTSVIVENGNTIYDSRDNCNAIIETATNTLIAGCKNTTIPNSVTSIGDGAFYDCTGLTSVTIPNSITSIGHYAFNDCIGLTSVTIPNSVTSIGNYAFRDCTGLTSVTIPNSVTSIGMSAFYGCSGLTSVVWNAKNYADFSSYISAPFYDIRTKITSFVFGNEVEYIPAYLCYGMTNVADIVIPNCHVQIGTNAFTECNYRVEGIYNITLPDTTLCYGDELYVDGERCDLSPDPEYFQTWTRTYQSVSGCDSIVEMSVRWTKLPSYIEITTKGEYDYQNSGSISISYQDRGHYDFYTLNGEQNASLSNLSSGKYVMIFYHTLCGDSLIKNITIEQYGIKVNNQYYLLDETNQTATLTYQGTSYDSYSGEYSGNIMIPKVITLNGKDYQVTGINSYTFSGCNNIKSIILESDTPLNIYNIGLKSGTIVYVPYGSLNAYKSSSSWRNYNLHVINPTHVSSISNATSANISFGNSEEKEHIVSCGVDGGGEFAGNKVEFNGLEPNSTYNDVPFFIKTKEGDYDTLHVSFTTNALELTTKPSKPVSSTTAILLAETNMSDAEVSCGFEYKRNDAPDDMAGTKVFCPVASGQMAGRLKNLKDDVYYKYRAFYQSAAGNMYYGDWQYIFTGDVAVEFDPILYTYGATVVKEKEATISGYALAGSEDFTEQGFEYWAETRANNGANAPHRMPAALGEHFFVQASGIALRATLTNLDAGTIYRYRVYGKVGDQYYYGSEQTFTTTGTYTPPTYTITFANWDGTELQSSQVEEGTLPEYTGATPERPENEQYTYSFNGWTPTIVIASADATYTATYTATPKSQGIEDVQGDDVQCTKILHDGQILILRGDKTYTTDGRLVR